MELDMAFFKIAAVLALFGLVYNWVVKWLEKDGRHEGYVAILVVGGVLATLGGLAVLRGFEIAVYVALLFVASGTPMILGSIARYMNKRAEDERRSKEDICASLEGWGYGDAEKGGGIGAQTGIESCKANEP
jgi:hypothetical protein